MSLVKHKLKSTDLKTEAKKQKEELERRKLGNQPAIRYFSESLEALKVKYEQYFLGIERFAPTEEHDKFKRLIRQMRQLNLKSSEDNFRINSIEQSYLTLNCLWERSLRQKEQGTYRRDVFKSKISAGTSNASRAKAPTDVMESSLVDKIFDDFKSKANVNLSANSQDKLKRILLVKIKELKQKHNSLDFRIELAMQDGKIGIRTH